MLSTILAFAMLAAAQAPPAPELSDADKLAAVEWELSLKQTELDASNCAIEDVSCLDRELVERFIADQWIRRRIDEICGPIQGRGPVDSCRARLGRRIMALDRDNLAFLRDVLQTHDWPVGEGWGPLAERGAWAIIQHAPPITAGGDPAPDPRPKALPHIAGAVKAGRLTQWHYDVMKARSEVFARME